MEWYLIMKDNKTLWAQNIVQRLQEAKIGDLRRLDHIRKILESGKDVYQSDMQYLQEKSRQLGQTYQNKPQQSEMIIHDMNFGETSSKLKKAINQEKKSLEVLDVVQKLIEAKLGDPDRLDYIKKALENGNALYESDKQFLEEKSNQLQKIVENQRKTELALQALDKLHESELRDSERLNAIKKALQEGKPVTESEINFLNTRYAKLQQEIDHQKRTRWTMDVIKRLHEAEIGDYARLEAIKTALEEGKNVDQSEISYLKEKYKILQQIDENKKVQWTIDTIAKLHEAEIGNYERLEKIKTALEERRNVDPEETSYLKEKFEQLLVIKKLKDTFDKNITESTEQENTDIISQINTKISELEKNTN